MHIHCGLKLSKGWFVYISLDSLWSMGGFTDSLTTEAGRAPPCFNKDILALITLEEDKI